MLCGWDTVDVAEVKSTCHREDSGWGRELCFHKVQKQRVAGQRHNDGPPRVAQVAKVSPESLPPGRDTKGVRRPLKENCQGLGRCSCPLQSLCSSDP